MGWLEKSNAIKSRVAINDYKKNRVVKRGGPAIFMTDNNSAAAWRVVVESADVYATGDAACLPARAGCHE